MKAGGGHVPNEITTKTELADTVKGGFSPLSYICLNTPKRASEQARWFLVVFLAFGFF